MGSNIQLYNANCLEKMLDIPDNSIDLVLCDLPYGLTANIEDKPLPLAEIWEHYQRILKDNGVVALFCQGLFYVDLVNSNRKWFKYDLIWDKVLTTGFLNANRMPLRQHEQLAVFYKNQPTYNPQKTIGKPNHSKGKPKTNQNNNYGIYGFVQNDTDDNLKHPTSIIQISKSHPSKAQHRTEKPIELCKWIIRTYTNEGDWVLDNCMGAGSAIIAAKECNRNAIGIELNTSIFNTAAERINNFKE